MQWAALVAMILKFLEQLPAILELIRKLFDGFNLQGSPDGIDQPAAVERVFAAARAKTWWFQFGKRAALNAAERVCVRRAYELVTAAMTGDVPPKMSASEKGELKAAL